MCWEDMVEGKDGRILEIEACCAYLARKTGSTPTVGSSRIRSCGF